MSALQRGIDVVINWKTIASSEPVKFEVERSFDGVHFSFVQSAGVQHNSVNIQTYSAVDAGVISNPGAVMYYRLKVINKNGTWEYSKVVTVQLAKGVKVIKISPNPFTNEFWLQVSSATNSVVSLRITNAKGAEALRQLYNIGRGNTQLTVTGLKPLSRGTYLVTVTINGEKQTFKVVK